jgi:hypothetical protein
VSLLADSIGFLEDTAVNLLILLALDRSARHRRGSAFLRDRAGSLPSALWQLEARSVPVGPQRCPGESGHEQQA